MSGPHVAMHALGVVAQLVIAGAGAHAAWTTWTTVAPQWRRILRLASGQIEPSTSPLPPQPRSLPGRHPVPHPRGVVAGAGQPGPRG